MGRFDLEPDRETDNALSKPYKGKKLKPGKPEPPVTPISDSQADTIVANLFRWTVDMPFPAADALSMVAAMVVDMYFADPSLQPLSGAYARAKRARGIE